MPIVKEFYFAILISCIFLLPTKMNAKRVECRYKYNHNAKFSLHAKMSVMNVCIMNEVPSGQP